MEEKKDMTFEEAMEQMELISEQLESGELPLEKSIELYQEGMKLSTFCHEKLSHFEKEIYTLVEVDGELKEQQINN